MGQNLGDPSPVMRMIELKYKEMKRSGRIPEIPIGQMVNTIHVSLIRPFKN